MSSSPASSLRSSTVAPDGSNISYGELDSVLDQFVTDVALTARDLHAHRHLTQILESVAKRYLHGTATVNVFGSAASGLGERGSDIDASMCVSPDILESQYGPTSIGMNGNTLTAASKAIKAIARGVQNYMEGWAQRGVRVEASIPTAKIPIVVLRTDSGHTCDISINNHLPVYNTRLLKCYADFDPRVKALILIVKRWAKILGVCDAKQGHLSSYSWTLLALYYLQVREEGALLPSLQRLASDESLTAVKSPTSFIAPGTNRQFNITYSTFEDAEVRGALPPPCDASIAELFHGFLKFYHYEYEWGREVVSIRKGERLTVDDKAFHGLARRDRRSGFFPHIEDPFDLERNLNCVMYFDCAQQLRQVFRIYVDSTDFAAIVDMVADSGRSIREAYDEEWRYMVQSQYGSHGYNNEWLVPTSSEPGSDENLWALRQPYGAPALNSGHKHILSHNGQSNAQRLVGGGVPNLYKGLHEGPSMIGTPHDTMALTASPTLHPSLGPSRAFSPEAGLDDLLSRLSLDQLLEVLKSGKVKNDSVAGGKLKGALVRKLTTEMATRNDSEKQMLVNKIQSLVGASAAVVPVAFPEKLKSSEIMMKTLATGTDQILANGFEDLPLRRHAMDSRSASRNGYYWQNMEGIWDRVDRW